MSVHGVLGIWGVLAVGIFAAGYPAIQGDAGTVATTNLAGQALGAAVMFCLGFIPGYILSLILRVFGLLRVSEAAELDGLDSTKVPSSAYPEGIPASA